MPGTPAERSSRRDLPDRLPYLVAKIPRSYAQRFVHEVLLRPLYGKSAVLDPSPRAKACRRLIWAWRERLDELFAASATPDRLRRMWRCPPSAFIPVGPKSAFCGQHNACPHCWGRWTLESWRDL